jgi:outer membrane protein
MKMKIKYWFASILILASLEAKQHTLNIDNIVEITLKHSPDIQSSRFDFEGAKQRTKAAESFYLPHLDFSANVGKQSSSFKNKADERVDILAGTLGASQLLYDFGKTAGYIGVNKEEALAYEAQMQQLISDKIYIVKKSYYDILKAKSLIEVQRKNVELQHQQLHRAKKYLISGIKTIIDVTDAQVQVEQANLDLENAKYDLELQYATLEEAMGYTPYGGDYKVYSKKLNLQNVSKYLPEVRTTLSSLESFAYEHRYALTSSKHIIKSAKSNVKTSKGDYYPTLMLGANYTAQHVDSLAPIIPENQGQISLQMQWNLFSGYKTDANVQEAKIAVLKASSELKSIKLAIKKQVVEAYIGVRRSKKNVQLSETIAKASAKKLEQAQKRYENELSDFVELQNAQQGYIESLSDLVRSYYNYYIALAQLDHSTGR